MEKNDKYKKDFIVLIVLILIVAAVIITLILSGKLTFAINSNNSTTTNNVVNNDTNNKPTTVDPYAKYSNMKWSTTIKFDENWYKVWIDENSNLSLQSYDWDSKTSSYDIAKAAVVKQLPNNEKVKYFECVTSPQAPVMEYIIALSTDNNLYYVGVDGSNKIFKLNSDSNKVVALTRNIDTKTQLQYTKNDIYALLDNGSLVKVYEEFKSDTNEIIAELGLTYEERNSHKTTIVVGPYGAGYYITSANYVRVEDLNRTYLLDENSNKLELQYYFQVSDYGNCYFVSKTNKLYKLDTTNNKIELVNSRIVSSVKLNGTVVNIKYQDNTSDEFELIPTTSYQNKISLSTNESYDFSNKTDREAYAAKYLFKQF